MSNNPEDKADVARRKLLKIGIYMPPAIIGSLVLTQGCQPASCNPTQTPCGPTNCHPVINPCGPQQCNPQNCNPNM